MQAQVQILYKVQHGKISISNMKSMQSVGFKQISTKFIEIFVP